MKIIYFFLFAALAACNTEKDSATSGIPEKPGRDSIDIDKQQTNSSAKLYANARFRNVNATSLGGGRYSIEGEAQIFEANFGWAVEDGHNELKKGHEMTDAGAPEWGRFKFSIEVEKQRPNSTLTLVLFESSAKDGTRQHELPVVLE